LYPLINYTASKQDIDDTVFNDWRKVVWVGGYDLSSINVDLNNFVFSVFYNRTLSAGRDLPLIVNIITNAVWKTAVKNLPDSKMILAGTKDFPRPRTLNDFDLISIVGRTLALLLPLSIPYSMLYSLQPLFISTSSICCSPSFFRISFSKRSTSSVKS
jgi:hypothetical protein